MNDKCEGLLFRAPAAPPDGLRQRVLTKVSRTLARQRRRQKFESALGLAMAALIVVSIAGNAAIAKSTGERLRQCAGPGLYERRVDAFMESAQDVLSRDAVPLLKEWLLARKPAADWTTVAGTASNPREDKVDPALDWIDEG